MGMPPWCLLAICTLISLSMLWGMWAGFACDVTTNCGLCIWDGNSPMMVIWRDSEHILSQWNPPSGAVEMATMTSVPVLLFKMRCMFFITVKTCLCALSRESALYFSSLSANPLLWGPLIFQHALPSQTVFDFLPQRPIGSAISYWTLWTIFGYFWLAETSNKPISLTTWLVDNP